MWKKRPLSWPADQSTSVINKCTAIKLRYTDLSHNGSVSNPLGSFTKHTYHNSLDCNKIAKGYARTAELCVPMGRPRKATKIW